VFTIGNKQRVVRAEPANLPGRCFPYAAIEPNYNLHSPSNVGIPENIKGLDYHISWLYNSRMQNVRKTLNNEWVVDPSLVEAKDLSDSEPGRMIRLARTAWGSGMANQAVFPLPVTDVTANHHNDSRITQEMGETVTGANRLIMGMSNTGRRAATEVQGQLSLASGRMKMLIELVVAQGMRPWASMMSRNTQVFLENSLNLRIREQYAGIVGADAQITPDLLQGNFLFPIGEGGMPNDRQFAANVWRELWTTGVQSGAAGPALQSVNWAMIFARFLQVMGVKDVRNFIGPPQPPVQAQVMPDAQVQQQQAAGNVVPTDGFALPSPQATPGVGMNGQGQLRGDGSPLQ
jgi:hypothetical protein